MMKKAVGYVVAVVGIGIMAFGFGMIPFKIAFLDGIAGNIISGVGIVTIVIGVALSLMAGGKKKGNGNAKGGENEVPIYEGVGKKRKVVGYRKD